jgi:hypothetical protein
MIYIFIYRRCGDLPGRDVLSGDGGVDLGVLRVAGLPGVGPGLGRRGAHEPDLRHPPGQPPLLWVPAGS